MVKFCALLACKNRDFRNEKEAGVKHHTFPQDECTRKLWMDFVNKYNRSKGWTTKERKGAYLCTEHFEKTCYGFTRRLNLYSVPTIAPKFTVETARKHLLIPHLQSTELLDKLNDFETEFSFGNDNLDFIPQDPLTSGASAEAPIDLPKSPTAELDRTVSVHCDFDLDDQGVQGLAVEFRDVKKENIAHSPPLMDLKRFASNENKPLRRQTSSFDSLKMNARGPKLFSTPFNRKRISYFGDITESDFNTKESSLRAWGILKGKYRGLQCKAKGLTQQVKRYRDKIRTLEAMLEHLQKKNLLEPEASTPFQITQRAVLG